MNTAIACALVPADVHANGSTRPVLFPDDRTHTCADAAANAYVIADGNAYVLVSACANGSSPPGFFVIQTDATAVARAIVNAFVNANAFAVADGSTHSGLIRSSSAYAPDIASATASDIANGLTHFGFFRSSVAVIADAIAFACAYVNALATANAHGIAYARAIACAHVTADGSTSIGLIQSSNTIADAVADACAYADAIANADANGSAHSELIRSANSANAFGNVAVTVNATAAANAFPNPTLTLPQRRPA